MMIIEIGRKIKQLRLDAGMTQEQLGEKLGVSAQAVSKWEANLTTPDIQLLPELSVTFGVTIDELFSMTDESRMERIDNMLEDVRFLTDGEFTDTERFLKEKMQADKTKARATLLLAQLYAKRGKEFNELAAPLARQALLLNPDEKAAHNAIFDAERGPYADWNVSNYWELIDFYKEFLKKHPENPRTYLWLLDLLIADGRTAEARHYLEAMDRVEHSFRTELYAGLIARAEGDVPRALSCWERMTGEFPEDWCAWSCRADCMAKLCRYDEAMAYYEKGLALQPSPKYVDMPEAMAQIAEIQGDYETAIAMRRTCMELTRTDWNITEGELLDCHQREINRLRDKMRT